MFKIRDKETNKVLTEDDLINGMYLIFDVHISLYGDVVIITENEDENGDLVNTVYDVSDRYEVVPIND